MNQSQIQKEFWVDVLTGCVYRRFATKTTPPWNKVGWAVGKRNRVRVKANGKTWHLHNLIWVYLNGNIPSGLFVDHIDRNEGNNHPDNLRLLTHAENCQNRVFSLGANPYTGVYKNKNKWSAHVKHSNHSGYIGLFSTPEDAKQARDAVIKSLGTYHPLPTF